MSNAMGQVVLRGSTGKRSHTHEILLNNVLYVPELDTNLLSCSELAKAGYSTCFKNDGCQILRNGKVFATGKLENGLYTMNATLKRSQDFS